MNDKIKIFEIDYLRQRLAKNQQLEELEKTYSGIYPEVEINTKEKWDTLTNMKYVPEFRIKRLEKVSKIIDPFSKILDIGVGWGDIVPILRNRNNNLDYTGIDFSEEVVLKLSKKFPKQKFLSLDIEKIEDQFDTVLLLEILEHMVPSKVINFLKRVKKNIKKDGELIVTVPVNENLIKHSFVCGHCGRLTNKMGHVRIYSPELIKSELKLAGYQTYYSELMYIGYYGLKGLIKRRLRNLAGRLVGPTDFKKAMPECIILKCKINNND